MVIIFRSTSHVTIGYIPRHYGFFEIQNLPDLVEFEFPKNLNICNAVIIRKIKTTSSMYMSRENNVTNEVYKRVTYIVSICLYIDKYGIFDIIY